MSSVPSFQRVQELFLWVACETDAFCPLPLRLVQYVTAPDSDAVRDLNFHVELAKCPFCHCAIELLTSNANGMVSQTNLTMSLFRTDDENPVFRSDQSSLQPELGPRHPDADRLHIEFAAVFQAQFDELVATIVQGRPKFSYIADMLVDQVISETQRRIDNDGFRPHQSWQSYLRWLVKVRTLALFRSKETAFFEGMANEAAFRKSAPDGRVVADLLKQEKRNRQGARFSKVLRAFSREYEVTSSGRTKKEIFERLLRSQEPPQITSEMGIALGTFYPYANECKNSIKESLRREDPEGSLFGNYFES
jgi:hypothetical protein